MFRNPTRAQREVLEAEDDVLVVGGAGTGKTTIALERARRFLQEQELAPDQRVLFLSFSNTAVRRIQEAARISYSYSERRVISVTTFHSFCYEVLEAHWALAGLGGPFQVLAPEDETVLRSRRDDTEGFDEVLTALEGEGKVCFDRFAPLVVELLGRVEVLRQAYASAYPLVIADEYQDTDDDQHALVARVAKPGQLICLGDPRQRIYEFRPGTRDDRLDQAEDDFALRRITLRDNHRSSEADLANVAAAILRGEPSIPEPESVVVHTYYTHAQLATRLKQTILGLEREIRRYREQLRGPVSIAIMGYRNRFVGTVSSLLLEPSGTFTHPFRHRILLRQDELSLSWQAVAAVLAPGRSVTARTVSVLDLAARQDRVEAGRSTSRIKHAEKLEEWADKLADGTLSTRARGVHELRNRLGGLVATWTGDLTEDSDRVANGFRQLPGDHLGHVVRVLELRPFGSQAAEMRSELEEAFAATGEYFGVVEATEQRLLQERLQGDVDAGIGRVLMTMHKCKGREFDATIIVDGRNRDSIVLPAERGQPRQPESRRLLATAVTRARLAAIVFTPGAEPCPLVPAFE